MLKWTNRHQGYLDAAIERQAKTAAAVLPYCDLKPIPPGGEISVMPSAAYPLFADDARADKDLNAWSNLRIDATSPGMHVQRRTYRLTQADNANPPESVVATLSVESNQGSPFFDPMGGALPSTAKKARWLVLLNLADNESMDTFDGSLATIRQDVQDHMGVGVTVHFDHFGPFDDRQSYRYGA